MSDGSIGEVNSRRLITPGTENWARSVRPGARNKYFVATVDSHTNEPENVYELGGIDPKYLPRVPHLVIDDEGRHLIHVEGWSRPQLVKGRPKPGEYSDLWDDENFSSVGQVWSDRMEPDDLERMRASSGKFADQPGLERLRADMDRDGVDAAVLFANRGLLAYSTHDPVFLKAMCRAWNTWALATFGGGADRFRVAAMVPTLDIDDALAEVQWAAANGFRTINLPCKPTYGPAVEGEIQYNSPTYDRLWAAIEETGMPMCIHVATGKDPRATTGPGGAIINKAIGGFASQVMEPVAMFLASGAFERFPKLRLVTVEADIGWIPWFLEALDGAFYRHHMWVRPQLKEPPSTYYRTNCASTFMEDLVGLELVRQHDLVENVMWTNDYPHMEGSWPHSAEAMERQLGRFSEIEREKILGLNAARIFGLEPKVVTGG